MRHIQMDVATDVGGKYSRRFQGKTSEKEEAEMELPWHCLLAMKIRQ